MTMILPVKAGLEKMVKFQWGINMMDERSSEPPHFLFLILSGFGNLNAKGFEKRAI